MDAARAAAAATAAGQPGAAGAAGLAVSALVGAARSAVAAVASRAVAGAAAGRVVAGVEPVGPFRGVVAEQRALAAAAAVGGDRAVDPHARALEQQAAAGPAATAAGAIRLGVHALAAAAARGHDAAARDQELAAGHQLEPAASAAADPAIEATYAAAAAAAQRDQRRASARLSARHRLPARRVVDLRAGAAGGGEGAASSAGAALEDAEVLHLAVGTAPVGAGLLVVAARSAAGIDSSGADEAGDVDVVGGDQDHRARSIHPELHAGRHAEGGRGHQQDVRPAVLADHDAVEDSLPAAGARELAGGGVYLVVVGGVVEDDRPVQLDDVARIEVGGRERQRDKAAATVGRTAVAAGIGAAAPVHDSAAGIVRAAAAVDATTAAAGRARRIERTSERDDEAEQKE